MLACLADLLHHNFLYMIAVSAILLLVLLEYSGWCNKQVVKNKNLADPHKSAVSSTPVDTAVLVNVAWLVV